MRWTKLDLICICFFLKKIIYHCFKSSPSICKPESTVRIFFIFWPNKIRVCPTGVVSSLFPSSVLPFLWPTLLHHCVMSHFLPIEPRWAHCLCFIFQQRFIPLPPLSSWNRSIESAPPPQATLPNRLTFSLHCYKKIISTLATLLIT
jgi:hypothetical protein